MQYICHSGGAQGADKAWKELGKPYGVKTIDWRPNHAHPSAMTPEGYGEMLTAVENAAKVLKRPHHFKGVELVHRNWFQVHHTQAIYAVSYIVPPGDVDFKGFENKTGKEIVAGGTGWAVEMGIQMGKSVYVFDISKNLWMIWSSSNNEFRLIGIPTLTESFAGIGSRILTPQGTQAIENVYKKTFNNENTKENSTS